MFDDAVLWKTGSRLRNTDNRRAVTLRLAHITTSGNENFMAPRVELEALERAELPLDEIGIAITRQSAWRAAGISAESSPRIITEPIEDRNGQPTHEFAGLAFDSATNQGWQIRGDVNDLDSINMVPTAATPLPSQEELLKAAEILRADDAFARIAEKGVVIYQPMPPWLT